MARSCSAASPVLRRSTTPPAVHEGLIAHRVLPPARSRTRGRRRGLPVLAHEVFLYMPGVSDSAGSSACSRYHMQPCRFLAVRHHQHPGTLFRSSIPSLHRPLSDASSAASRPPSHGSEPEWFAIPSLYDSFIRYFMPVYPGAIRTQRRPRAPVLDNSPEAFWSVSLTTWKLLLSCSSGVRDHTVHLTEDLSRIGSVERPRALPRDYTSAWIRKRCPVSED
jgi:hypothetical protein